MYTLLRQYLNRMYNVKRNNDSLYKIDNLTVLYTTYEDCTQTRK